MDGWMDEVWFESLEWMDGVEGGREDWDEWRSTTTMWNKTPTKTAKPTELTDGDWLFYVDCSAHYSLIEPTPKATLVG